MPSLIDMRRRIRAVKSTQQITKAMKMVAASKLRRAQEKVVATRPFATQAKRVLASISSRVDAAAHPLLEKRPGATTGNTLVIVESPNKVASIAKYLGQGHTVASTKGHFADVPERKGSVDVNNVFAMDYRVTTKGAAVVEELRRLQIGRAHV